MKRNNADLFLLPSLIIFTSDANNSELKSTLLILRGK